MLRIGSFRDLSDRLRGLCRFIGERGRGAQSRVGRRGDPVENAVVQFGQSRRLAQYARQRGEGFRNTADGSGKGVKKV